MNKLVYLAGPITGLSFNDATNWRYYAQDVLGKAGITALSPLRAKDYLAGEQKIADSYEHKALSCRRGIMTRDRFDVCRCDVLVVNLLGTEKVTIGTVMEMGWADLLRKPIVTILEDGNIHDHSMVREASGFVVPTVDAALDLVKAILA